MPVEAPDFAIVTGQQVPGNIKPLVLSRVMQEAAQVPVTLEWIQGLLRQEVGGSLPQALIEQLGFDQLGWKIVHFRDSLPFLFLGTPGTQQEPIPLAEATGTIYVDRFVSGSNMDNKVTVRDLGIAGIGRASDGSTRVLALQYSPYFKLAYHVDVSVSQAELPPPTDPLAFWARHNYDYVARPIPSTAETVYHIGGIVTERMVLATAGAGQSDHRRVFSSYDAECKGNQVLPLDNGYLSKDLGFTVVSATNLHRISYQSPAEPISWQVAFPKGLE